MSLRAKVVFFALVGVACDASSQPPPSESAPPVEPTPSEPAPVEPEPVEPEPSEPVQPPAPVGGPHCDQRESKHTCIDFTAHTGVTEVRCFEGAELLEGSCPNEAVIASCTLPTTGVTVLHYEGSPLETAQSNCEAMGGRFEPAGQ